MDEAGRFGFTSETQKGGAGSTADAVWAEGQSPGEHFLPQPMPYCSRDDPVP